MAVEGQVHHGTTKLAQEPRFRSSGIGAMFGSIYTRANSNFNQSWAQPLHSLPPRLMTAVSRSDAANPAIAAHA